MTSTSLRVGVVGGSISGCLCALELLRAGHRVTVFERAREESFEGLLGAGLGTPSATFETLVARGLVDADLPHIALEDMAFVGGAAGGERRGRIALTVPLDFISFHWRDLRHALRTRVPDGAYRAGDRVTGVRTLDDAAVVALEDGREERFDLVVCADGHDSECRRALFPGVEPEYQGYVCWRGVLHERELDSCELPESRFARFGSRLLPGSFLYPVPGPEGSGAAGRRSINFGCYLPVAGEELPGYLVGEDGRRHHGAVPPGQLRLDEEARLGSLARESLPPAYADIVSATRDTFVQAIYAVEVPAYHSGRICLTGDAGSLAPPFTGSGIFKAATNAIELARALARSEQPDHALARWGAAQTALGERLLDLARQYHRTFIGSHPDFAEMDEETTRAWWRRSVTYPEGFTFESAQP